MKRLAKLPTKVKELLAKGINGLREAWATEPTRVIWAAAAVIEVVLAKLGVNIAEADIVEILVLLVPVILGASVNRAKVTPTAKLRK